MTTTQMIPTMQIITGKIPIILPIITSIMALDIRPDQI